MKTIIYKVLAWGSTLMLAFLGIGCDSGNESSGKIRFLLPWSEEASTYNLQEVAISTLPDPYRLKGKAAEVYVNSYVSRHGFVGDVAKPNLSKVKNGLYIPADPASWLAISVYAHFERLYLMDRRLGIEDNLRWPRQVGVEIATNVADKASYYPGADVVVVGRRSKNGKKLKKGPVPVSMNGGILAHEHFHAHFYKLVKKPLMDSIPSTGQRHSTESDSQSSFTDACDRYFGSSILRYNFELVEAWNEGLADFWGYVYSGNSYFIGETLTHRRQVRSLANAVKPLTSIEQLSSLIAHGAGRDICGRPLWIYERGTEVASALRAVVEADTEKHISKTAQREKWAGHILSRLALAPQILVPLVGKEKLSPDFIFSVLFEDHLELNAEQCKEIAVAMNSSGSSLRVCRGVKP